MGNVTSGRGWGGTSLRKFGDLLMNVERVIIRAEVFAF